MLKPSDWKKALQIAALSEPFSINTKFLQFKNRSVSAAKLSFLNFLDSSIKNARNGQVEFEGEAKEVFNTKITTALAIEMLQRLKKNFNDKFGSYLKVFETSNTSLEILSDLTYLDFDPRFRS